MSDTPTGVDPGDAADVLKRLLSTWDVASERMLTAVARRLARGVTDTGWAELKARQTLHVRDELAAILARLERATPDMAGAALDEAYRLGVSTATVTERAVPLGSRPEVVQQLTRRYVDQLHGTHVPVLRAHMDLYQRATTETEQLVQTGTMVRRDAVSATVDRLLRDGVGRFTDKAGRSWQLDSYARMAGRSIAGQTAVQGQLDEMRAQGRDVVIVRGSGRSCRLCDDWNGRLLSITGESVGQTVNGVRVTATVAEAVAAGLHHPNCRCRLDPVTRYTRMGATKQNHPDAYDAEQRLRGMERKARDLKRRQVAAEQFGDTPTARRLRARIRGNSHRIAAFTDAHDLMRRRDREQLVRGNGTLPRPAQVQPGPAIPEPRPAVGQVGSPRVDAEQAAREHAAAEHAAQQPPEPAPALDELDDAQLAARMDEAAAAGDDNMLDAVLAEMDRRAEAPAEPAPAPPEPAPEPTDTAAPEPVDEGPDAEKWAEVDRLVDEEGLDYEAAYAEVFEVNADRLRRDEAIRQLRDSGYVGRGFDELARAAFRDQLALDYNQAEDATRGYLLNRQGQARGMDPRELWSQNEAFARKWASDELKEWWDAHGRLTYYEFSARLLSGQNEQRFRTGGSTWLQ